MNNDILKAKKEMKNMIDNMIDNKEIDLPKHIPFIFSGSFIMLETSSYITDCIITKGISIYKDIIEKEKEENENGKK